jgi:C-terminal processing protease CtpA/Prc
VSWASFADPWVGTWTGPVYVVADRRSYSSAEMFAAVAQDNGIAKIAGTRTGGDGCGFMTDAPPLVLPHSRLRFRIPNCMRLRADGSNEEAGVTPDIAIVPTEGESDRARAMRASTAIADDVRRSVR